MTNAAYYLTFTYAVERRKSLSGEGGEAFLLANTLEPVGRSRLEAARGLAVGPRGSPAIDDGVDRRTMGLIYTRSA